jgi:1-acyl-sn-glycerol-3-phosphate acyltransferase
MFDNILYSICKTICQVTLRIICHIRIFGHDNIPEEGPVILASNHVSYLDPVLVGLTTKRKVYFMARESLFRIPVFGWIIRHVSAFPIKRDGVSDTSAIKRSLKLLKKGEVVGIFPEGTRSTAGNLLEAQAGIGMIALKSQAAVIPIFIKGADKALPKGARMIKPARIEVICGKPIFAPKEKGRRSYTDFSAKIMHSIKSLQN